MKAIINGRVVLEKGVIENGFVLFDERILKIGDMKDYEEQAKEVVDACGQIVCPGFIDIHVHGAGGSDTMDGTPEAIETLSATILKSGVTRFLATTMTMSTDAIKNALSTVKAHMEHQAERSDLAQITGVHLEGPFINASKKGAQNGAYIVQPNMELIGDYLDIIKIITIAPETDVDFEFINQMKAHPEIQLSIGHTNSNFDTAMEAYKNGVTHITHCFNAMPPLHHREPGVIGAMLSESFSTELIADGIHVHKGLFKGMCRCVDHDKLILITDSMRAGGLEDGDYDLGGQNVIVKDGACRLEDGTLAGSVLTMNRALRNFNENTEIPLNEVINLATINPAEVIGIGGEFGSLEAGKVADINIVDQQFNIIRTFVKGR